METLVEGKTVKLNVVLTDIPINLCSGKSSLNTELSICVFLALIDGWSERYKDAYSTHCGGESIFEVKYRMTSNAVLCGVLRMRS